MNRTTFVAGAAATCAGLTIREAGQAAGITSIDITIAHYPEQDYALPVVIAQQLGYLAREGINVNSITGSEGGGTTVRNISQGGLLMGQVATPAAIKAILAGEDLKIFAGAVQAAGTNAWVVFKNSPIKTIHDFVGKTVGFTNPGGASEALLKLSLLAANVDIAKVTAKAAGGLGENLTLLKTGGLDVGFTDDPLLTQHKDELRVIFFAREYVPSFLQTVWLASPATIANQTPLLAGFMRAWAKAVDYLWAHPIDCATRYAHVANADPNLIAITLADEQVRSYFGQGQLTANAFAVVAKSMRLGNVLGPNEKIDLSKIIDQRALPVALRTDMNVSV